MGKSITDAVMDAMLAAAEGDRIFVCAGAPADYTAASVTNKLAEVTVSGVDYTKANGDTSGRKNTASAKSGLSIDATGDADHVVHAAHKHEILDPS